MITIVAHRVGQAHDVQAGERRIAAAKTNPVATKINNPAVLNTASILLPRLPSWSAGEQPGSATRQASRSIGVSNSPRPNMDKDSKIATVVASRPLPEVPRRNATRRPSQANAMVPAPASVMVITRNQP